MEISLFGGCYFFKVGMLWKKHREKCRLARRGMLMLLLEEMLPTAQQRSGEKNKPSSPPRLNQHCLGVLESRGGQRKKTKTCPHVLPRCQWPFSCQSLGYVFLWIAEETIGRMAGDAAGLRFTSAVAEGWLCSSSVGCGYAISGTSLQQNFVKIGKGRGTLQRFASLNMAREGSRQGHRLERGLKNVCGEISVRCFT